MKGMLHSEGYTFQKNLKICNENINKNNFFCLIPDSKIYSYGVFVIFVKVSQKKSHFTTWTFNLIALISQLLQNICTLFGIFIYFYEFFASFCNKKRQKAMMIPRSVVKLDNEQTFPGSFYWHSCLQKLFSSLHLQQSSCFLERKSFHYKEIWLQVFYKVLE